MKIAIVGTGKVGSTLAYCLVLKQLCEYLVISGRTSGMAWGDALDLRHALAFCPRPMQVDGCTNGEVSDCDIVVVTASVPSLAGSSSRMDLGLGNVAVFRKLIPMLAANNPKALFLILTNPVDVMTFAAQQFSGFAPERVMGVGTLVDSARFRAMLSHELNIHPQDLRTYVLGEHGPNQFPVLGNAMAGGERLGNTPQNRQIFEQVMNAGLEVYQYKGYTNHAIATAASMVIESIVYDENRTLPLSIHFDEWMGIQDNCFSIPVVVGRKGVVRALRPELDEAELLALQKAATAVKAGIQDLLPDSKLRL